MKYRSPTEKPVRIALLSGHTALVTRDWRELDPMFHTDALAARCECDKTVVQGKDVKVKAGPNAQNQTPDVATAIRQAIETMQDRNDAGDFTGDGLPNMRALAKVCGFNVNKEEALKVFHAMQDERTAKVRDSLIALIERSQADDLTAEGLPTVDAASDLAGMRLSRAEIDKVWAELQDELKD